MKKDILSEQYQNVYTKILPSDELAQDILRLSDKICGEKDQKVIFADRLKIRRSVQRKRAYVAAGVAFAILCSTITGYAVTHASVVKEFFGNGNQTQAAQEYYSEIGKTIVCDGNRYMIEGNIYSEEVGKGYLSIKINGKEENAPDVLWDDGRMPASRGTLDVLGLEVEKSYVGILFSEDIGYTAKMEKEEDGTYIYIAYQVEAAQKDQLKLAIQPQNVIEENYKKLCEKNDNQTSAVREAFYQICDWTDLTYQKMETIKTEYSNGVTVWMNHFDIRIEWNENVNKIENIALIDSEGKRQEILKNGSLVSNEGQWDGSSMELSENGDCILNARFNDVIIPEKVQVEIN